jgi:hypothetical protein
VDEVAVPRPVDITAMPRALHDLNLPPEFLLFPGPSCSRIPLIEPDVCQAGNASQAPARTRGTPARSWMSAVCTHAMSTRPVVSASRWRFRPLSRLAPS